MIREKQHLCKRGFIAFLLCCLIFASFAMITACSNVKPTEAHNFEATGAATETAYVTEETIYTPSPTALPHISWTEEYYVDDFNDPTDKTYIRGHFTGTFSNSATSGSRLSVYLYFDKDLTGQSTDSFHIRLFEYGDYLVNYNLVDAKDINIKVKIDGQVYESRPYELSEKNIYIKRYSSVYRPIINALNSGKEISVVITESKYSTSTYRFTIDSYGLSEIEHNWKG